MTLVQYDVSQINGKNCKLSHRQIKTSDDIVFDSLRKNRCILCIYRGTAIFAYELEKLGLRLVRHGDDCVIAVRSEAGAKRGMYSIMD